MSGSMFQKRFSMLLIQIVDFFKVLEELLIGGA